MSKLTKERIKQIIVQYIDSTTGTKAVVLVTNLMAIDEVRGSDFDILPLIDELVTERRILELEYVLPDSNYRIRSIYFPKGTELKMG